MADHASTGDPSPGNMNRFANDPQGLREYCKTCTREELDAAHSEVADAHPHLAAIARDEIDRRDLAVAEEVADKRYLERNFSSKLTHRLAILLAVIGTIVLAMLAFHYAGKW